MQTNKPTRRIQEFKKVIFSRVLSCEFELQSFFIFSTFRQQRPTASLSTSQARCQPTQHAIEAQRAKAAHPTVRQVELQFQQPENNIPKKISEKKNKTKASTSGANAQPTDRRERR
jgi:signal recognition particle subunit SEC65